MVVSVGRECGSLMLLVEALRRVDVFWFWTR